jgi:integrase
MPKLTPASIRTYQPNAERREIRDAGALGLFLIIQPSGAKSFALRFRRNGKPAKMTLGPVDLSKEPSDKPQIGGALTLGQARELAAKLSRDRARGIDVIEEAKAERLRQSTEKADRVANSFGALLPEYYIDYRTKNHERPRQWRETARLLGLDYPPDCDPARTEPRVIVGSVAAKWQNKPVSVIDGSAILVMVDAARKHGIPGLPVHNKDISENRGRKLHAALSVFFAWAKAKQKVTSNPTLGVSHPGAPPARDRVLTTDEVRWFWKACEKIGPPYGPLCQILLLTGQRLGEVTGMTRAELNGGADWILPRSRTKNHREHVVPLPPVARTIIEAQPRIENPSGLVFTISGKLLTGFSRAKPALDKAMADIANTTIPPWTLHDLRRTAATGMADLGILPHVIEAVLNHVSGSKGGVAGIYNRAEYAAEKKAALERWAVHLQGLVSGQPANVVSLRSGA